MVIYVSGAFTGNGTRRAKKLNTRIACAAAIDILRRKHSVICPHLNTGVEMEDMAGDVLTYDDYLRNDVELLKRSCDACYFLPGWKDSRGARIEMEACNKIQSVIADFQIFFNLDDIPDLSRGAT